MDEIWLITLPERATVTVPRGAAAPFICVSSGEVTVILAFFIFL